MPDQSMEGDLRAWFDAHTGRLVHKWVHYLPIYERHLAPFRHRPVTLVEIGVSHGGSLQLWRHHLGHEARIVGVDHDPRCAGLTDLGAEIVIGDQGDEAFLRSLAGELGPIDVVIDDGGHRMDQQLASFTALWPSVVAGGIYLVEDLHTSYWERWGGGLRRPGTSIEHAKDLIDAMHAWHTDGVVEVDDMTRTLGGMHVYDSLIVFDEGDVAAPHAEMRGVPSFDDGSVPSPQDR